MNTPQRLKIKFFYQDDVPAAEQFLPLFHRWIQEDRLAEHLLLDVADYKHVPNSLATLLVAHEADLAFDTEGDKPGFSYIRKRAWPETQTLDARLEFSLAQALNAVEALELEDLPKLDLESLEIRFLDRLAIPDTQEELDTVLVATKKAVSQLYGTHDISICQLKEDKRRAFGLSIKVKRPCEEALAA